jgi:hypothetical protein
MDGEVETKFYLQEVDAERPGRSRNYKKRRENCFEKPGLKLKVQVNLGKGDS